mgnify:FL=1|tara:strand:+ start:44766 stop:45551 length:786 start_codon:yes stop_codon:yes gene_type:complete
MRVYQKMKSLFSAASILSEAQKKIQSGDATFLASNVSLGAATTRLKHHRIEINDFISLGAGSGSDSIWIHDALCPNAQLLMIEAQELHRINLEKLKNSKNHTDYLICAAAKQDGEVHFSSSSATGGVIGSHAGDGTITVPARSVDSLMAERGRKGPYFMKFDTHGVELDILAGAKETLKNTSLIMVEAYNFKLNFVDHKNLTFYEMCEYMAQLGLRCVDMCEPLFRPNDHVLWQVHLFFIRDDHPVFNSNSYNAKDPFKSL